MKAAIITDSTATLSDDLLNKENIYCINLTFSLSDGTVHVDTNDRKETEQFYRDMEASREIPKTSQPSPQTYYDIMDDIVAKGYDTVFCIHIASALSGTYQLAKNVTNDYRDKIDVHIQDTKGISFYLENMIQLILEMVDKDYSGDEIDKNIKYLADNCLIYATVPNLKNLAKGGRIGNVAASIGTALKFVPIISIKDGKVGLVEKVRTKKRAYKKIRDLMIEQSKTYPYGYKIAMADALADDMEETESFIMEAFPGSNLISGYLTPVIGVHAGVGVIGFCVIPKLDFEKS